MGSGPSGTRKAGASGSLSWGQPGVQCKFQGNQYQDYIEKHCLKKNQSKFLKNEMDLWALFGCILQILILYSFTFSIICSLLLWFIPRQIGSFYSELCFSEF